MTKRDMARRGVRGVVAMAVVLAAGCRTPQTDAAIAEQLQQMTNEIIGMRDQVAQLNTTVDSLVQVAARQDTALKRVMAASGVPTP